jgi:hypothetical protein
MLRVAQPYSSSALYGSNRKSINMLARADYSLL